MEGIEQRLEAGSRSTSRAQLQQLQQHPSTAGEPPCRRGPVVARCSAPNRMPLLPLRSLHARLRPPLRPCCSPAWARWGAPPQLRLLASSSGGGGGTGGTGGAAARRQPRPAPEAGTALIDQRYHWVPPPPPPHPLPCRAPVPTQPARAAALQGGDVRHDRRGGLARAALRLQLHGARRREALQLQGPVHAGVRPPALLRPSARG